MNPASRRARTDTKPEFFRGIPGVTSLGGVVCSVWLEMPHDTRAASLRADPRHTALWLLHFF